MDETTGRPLIERLEDEGLLDVMRMVEDEMATVIFVGEAEEPKPV